jgi:hypothetical protein
MSYIENARVRARRRKSPWDLLLFPAVFLSWMGLFLVLLQGIGALHQHVHPGQSLTNSQGLTVLLATIPLFFAAMPIGFIAGNILVWLVPPARRALDSEAKPHPGTDFFSAQRGLLKIAAYVTPFSLALAIVGALLPWCAKWA